MSSVFLYQVELPFSKQTVQFREIPTKDQLFISKSLLALSEKDPYWINLLESLLQRNIQNGQISSLSIVECLLLAIRIRISSMGSKSTLQVSQASTKTMVELDFEIFLKNLFQGIENIDKNSWIKHITIEDITIDVLLGWPTWFQFTTLLNIIQNYSNPTDIIKNIVPLFIKKLSITKEGNIFDYMENNKVLDLSSLPASIMIPIQNQVLENIYKLSEIDLFGIDHLNSLRLNLLDPSFVELFKLLFLFDLKDIHREIFELSSFLETEYILNLSALERKLYFSFLPETVTPSKPVGSSAIQSLTKEFGG